MSSCSCGSDTNTCDLSASKIHNGHEVLLIAELKSADQHINCYAMCDEIGITPRTRSHPIKNIAC